MQDVELCLVNMISIFLNNIHNVVLCNEVLLLYSCVMGKFMDFMCTHEFMLSYSVHWLTCRIYACLVYGNK